MKIDYLDFDILYTKEKGYYICYVYDLNNTIKLKINMNLCKEIELLHYIKDNYDIFFIK